MKKVLALDVGDRRIGVAVSDELLMFAHPRPGINRGGKKEYAEILQVTKNEAVREILVGMPLELSGAVGPQAEKVLKFADALERLLERSDGFEGVGVKLWDERMTTVEAQRHLVGKKQLKDVRRREALDQVAAVVLLESYLKSLENIG